MFAASISPTGLPSSPARRPANLRRRSRSHGSLPRRPSTPRSTRAVNPLADTRITESGCSRFRGMHWCCSWVSRCSSTHSTASRYHRGPHVTFVAAASPRIDGPFIIEWLPRGLNATQCLRTQAHDPTNPEQGCVPGEAPPDESPRTTRYASPHPSTWCASCFPSCPGAFCDAAASGQRASAHENRRSIRRSGSDLLLGQLEEKLARRTGLFNRPESRIRCSPPGLRGPQGPIHLYRDCIISIIQISLTSAVPIL